MLDRPGPRILGVRTTTQLDKAFEDGLLVEKTFDYFAQDKRGNVWYMGEDVTNFHYDDDGNLIGKDHESAWRAGRRGAKPGWIMPARQIIGQRYFQEHRPPRRGARQGPDPRAYVGRLRVGGTVYRNVLRVLETNPFEPKSPRDQVLCAPGRHDPDEEGLNKNLKNPDLVFSRDDDGRRDRAERADAPTRPRRARRRQGATRSAAIGAPGASGADGDARRQGAAAPAAPHSTTTFAPICTRS